MVCAEQVIDSSVNIALGKSYTLSEWKKNTSYWDTTPPTKLTDGNLSTDYGDSPAWGNMETGGTIQGDITIDLSTVYDNIALIRVLAASHYFYYPTKIMAFSSVNGTDWTPIGLTNTMLIGGWWNITPKRKVSGRYIKLILEKNDCGGVYERFHVSEIEVYRAKLCLPRQKRVSAVVPSNVQNDWGFTAYGNFAYLTSYLTSALYKVDIRNHRLVDQTILTSSAPPSKSHPLPTKNHVIVGGQTGTYVAVDMDTLEVIEDNSDGHFPESRTTDRCCEGIANDDKYLYLNEGYTPQVRIHYMDDYTEAENPVEVSEAGHTWGIYTSEKYDQILVIEGDDTWGAGAVHIIYKDDWTVQQIDYIGDHETLFSAAIHDKGYFVGGNGVLRGYDWNGELILSEAVSNAIYNMGIINDTLIYSHSYRGSDNTHLLSAKSVNDLDFTFNLGRFPFGFRGVAVNNNAFVYDSMTTGQLISLRF